jgi:hypothetical protein
VGAVIGAVVFLGAAQAQAQQFGKQGDISFAGDRLMGFYIADADRADSQFTMGIAGPPLCCSIFQSPRLGIDGFIIDHLSLGGSIWIWHYSGPDRTGLLFGPRVGYAIPFSEHFGIWPRGGLTFWNTSRDDNDGIALTAEAMFYATPGEWGFLFGPTLDFEFDDPNWRSFGLIAGGVFGWL